MNNKSIKCPYCNKIFFALDNQETCPFCHQSLIQGINSLPDFMQDFFGKNKENSNE